MALMVDGGYKNEWHLLIAYPENGYQSCVNAAEKKVETTVALWRELYSSTGNISIKDDGQTVKYTSNYPGDGFDSRRFVCLPDTINPKIKQIK